MTNLLRVLNLPEEIKESVDKGTLTVGHARALLALNMPEQQLEMARRIMADGLSVRATETLVSQSNIIEEPAVESSAPEKSTVIQRTDVYLKAVEEDLTRALGTKVRLVSRKKGGKIEIEYYSNDELEGLVQRLKG